MADSRFFDRLGPFSLREIAEAAQAELPRESDPDLPFEDVAPLHSAGASDVGFLDNRKYLAAFRRTAAGACLVSAEHAALAPPGTTAIVCESPYVAYARVAWLFYPTAGVPGPHESGVHPSASVGPDCDISSQSTVGPNATIGAGTRIGAGVYIGRGVCIGTHCVVHPGATITHAIVGDRVEIHPGARIGQDGFGFATNPPGYLTVPQLGRVLIGDDVSIGANTSIDRGAGPDTVIGDSCRIDNLVQIAHNVQIGRGCVIAAQVGISGSTKIGDFGVFGGQVGVAGHITVAPGVTFAAKSGVTRSITRPGTYGGFPAVPIREWRASVASIKRMVKNMRSRGDD